VTVSPASVLIAKNDDNSQPFTVVVGHDRNTTSDAVELTATISALSGSDANYVGRTTKVPVMAADDDYTVTPDLKVLTEKTPFTDVDGKWVTILVSRSADPPATTLTLGESGSTDYTFREFAFNQAFTGPAAPYDGTTTVITEVTLNDYTYLKPGQSRADVWLVANDDTEEEQTEFVQFGADPTGEANRIVPALVPLLDADPDVTLSIDAVAEGADGVTLTVKATSAGPMPGIFDLPADRWQLVDEGGALATAGYVFTASGPLTIDRNETSGTVTVTVTTPEDEDTDNEMLKIGLTTEQSVTLADATDLKVSVGMLEITVEDDDEENGGG
jgi:hypothetical protein